MEIVELFEIMEKVEPKLLTSPDGKLTTATLDCAEPIICTSHKELRTQVDEFVKRYPKCQGWLCFQSHIRSFVEGKISDLGNIQYGEFEEGKIPDLGNIQYGEIAGDDFTSLLIRPAENGAWRVVRFTEKAGFAHLVTPERHLGRHKLGPAEEGKAIEVPGNLRYRVYWRHDAEQGFLPFASRFAGFEPFPNDTEKEAVNA